MNTLIITGGRIDTDFASAFIEDLKADYVIGVDRGLTYCYETGFRPDYIVGDFDSLDPKILEWYREEGKIPIRTYNPVKDATDTMIALEKALALGSNEIWILGGTGSRIDHVLCNLQILKNAWEAGVPCWMVDPNNRIGIPVEKSFTLEKTNQYGDYVSFFPLEADVKNLSLDGFAYNLDHYHLVNKEGLGVSNEIVEAQARVSYEEGILLMIQSRD